MKKRITALLLSIIMIMSVCVTAFAQDEQGSIRPEVIDPITDEDFLHTQGEYLVNKNGEKVTLHGVNLGSWMVWEDWLTATQDDEGNMSLDMYTVLSTLEERFGTEKAYELINTYMDNFIISADFFLIKNMGFNCVRVPFWYRNFYYDDNGTKILNDEGEWDFSRLDWVIDECTKKGLYVILDMHGAVGYQSDAPHSGKGNSCGLFDQNEQGEKYRTLTKELWSAIASRYKDEPCVAMYDLLNEPMCDVEATEVQRRINNEYIYSMLYDTVRGADENHIITVEGIWTPFALPKLKLAKGWNNVVYQVHFYQKSDFIFNFFVFFARLWCYDVPMLMGEFYPHNKCTWSNCFKTMKTCRFNWCLWTYKATGHGMWSSDWCIYGAKDGFERVNIDSDSFDEIQRKWGSNLITEFGYQSTGHFENNVADWV